MYCIKNCIEVWIATFLKKKSVFFLNYSVAVIFHTIRGKLKICGNGSNTNTEINILYLFIILLHFLSHTVANISTL